MCVVDYMLCANTFCQYIQDMSWALYMGMLHSRSLSTEAALFLLLELVGGQAEPSHWSCPRVAWRMLDYYETDCWTVTHIESLHDPLDDLEGSVVLHGDTCLPQQPHRGARGPGVDDETVAFPSDRS